MWRSTKLLQVTLLLDVAMLDTLVMVSICCYEANFFTRLANFEAFILNISFSQLVVWQCSRSVIK